MRHKARLAVCAAALAALIATHAWSQSAWRPEKAVEIVVPTGAGGLNDVMARLIQKIMQDQKLVPTPVVVMNKAGGNQTLAAVYLRQHPADPHYLLYSTSSVFTAEITGLTRQHYTDLTPIALMVVERTAITVRVDLPIRNMREQGIDVAGVTNWRGVFGARGFTPPQIAYWEDVLAKVGSAEEWRKQLDQQGLGRQALFGRDFAKWLENEYSVSRAVLTDLGFAK